jgi:hypothetical protein
MAMADDCRVPLFRHEREHHILVGAPDSLLGVGRDSHVQLGGGSAALSWLYRALCNDCMRTCENANLGDCAYPLEVWMWEHFLVRTRVCLR